MAAIKPAYTSFVSPLTDAILDEYAPYASDYEYTANDTALRTKFVSDTTAAKNAAINETLDYQAHKWYRIAAERRDIDPDETPFDLSKLEDPSLFLQVLKWRTLLEFYKNRRVNTSDNNRDSEIVKVVQDYWQQAVEELYGALDGPWYRWDNTKTLAQQDVNVGRQIFSPFIG